MHKLTFTQGECQAITERGERFFLSFGDYPELASLYEQAVEIVNTYRTPEQERIDNIVALAVSADPDSASELIPDWQEWTEYRVGEHVVYEGTIYRIVQSHRSQHDWLPPHVPALYTVANKTTTDPVDPETGYPEWVQPAGQHDAYNMGDRVMFNGLAYQSVVDGNVWSPTDHPEGWVEIDLPEEPEDPENPEEPEDPEPPEEPEEPEEPAEPDEPEPEGPGDDYPEWVQPTGAHDAYNTGDRVTFEGRAYESISDGNTWSPITAGWKEID